MSNASQSFWSNVSPPKFLCDGDRSKTTDQSPGNTNAWSVIVGSQKLCYRRVICTRLSRLKHHIIGTTRNFQLFLSIKHPQRFVVLKLYSKKRFMFSQSVTNKEKDYFKFMWFLGWEGVPTAAPYQPYQLYGSDNLIEKFDLQFPI